MNKEPIKRQLTFLGFIFEKKRGRVFTIYCDNDKILSMKFIEKRIFYDDSYNETGDLN